MKKLITALTALVAIAACDKKNDDLVLPLTELPQVVKFDDEGDGGLEDEDKFSFVLTLNDKKDPSGKELAGAVVPLTENVTVNFAIKDLEGFDHLANFITGWKAFYEIDECTTSGDLPMEFDPATGKGSVQFPAGVSELELEFETDDSFFADDVVNEEERSLTVVLTGIEPGKENVVINTGGEFTYEVLDDEAVYGDWELDHENAETFARFKTLFGIVNEDIAALSADEVNKIEISIEYNEINLVVELKETETITECNETEEVNKTIAIETGIEELNADGDLEIAGEMEEDNGSVKEFVYKGTYAIDGGSLELRLHGEYDDNETATTTLLLTR